MRRGLLLLAGLGAYWWLKKNRSGAVRVKVDENPGITQFPTVSVTHAPRTSVDLGREREAEAYDRPPEQL